MTAKRRTAYCRREGGTPREDQEQILCPSATTRRILRDTKKEDSTRAAPAHELLKNITGTRQAGPAA